MKFYFAPMEGITGYIYRSAHHACFYPADKYFTPFISPKHNSKKSFTARELNDILPEHNQGLHLVPQILTNQSEDFIRVAKDLRSYGYEEVNLNLGCPSKTVVTKKKGSGFLVQLPELTRFLHDIFMSLDMKISVKTRLGKEDPEEFYPLLEIFNQFPMEELIIHPRIQSDYYKMPVRLEMFREAVKLSKNPLCYNGDIFTLEDYRRFCQEFPEVETLMMGRGVLRNPGLPGQIAQMEKESDCNKRLETEEHITIGKNNLREFHDRIYKEYRKVSSGDRNVLFKMKELWAYMIVLFAEPKKYEKLIKKSEKLSAYEMAVDGLFRECRIK